MTRAQCYQLLGLRPGASEEEIRRHYKRMALKVHPDINPDPKANEQFIQLTKAVEILLSPPKPTTPQERRAQRATPETEAEKKRRMDEARQRYEQQKNRKRYEDTHYFNQLTSGKRWTYFKWLIRAGWVLALALILDTVLPAHFEHDQLMAYSSTNHNGILFERITAIHLNKAGDYYTEIKRSNWLNSYPDVIIEESWLLHTPVRMYTTDDFIRQQTGFDFHIGSIRWLLIIVLMVPLLTYFRQRKDLTFVFLYQFSFWGVGILIAYLLLTEHRLTHLLTLGFL
jgi:hypothetical protein